MDGWVPKGGSVPPAADGAFERFLTAAIAAIITIMFSWRLLDEMGSDVDKDGGNVEGREEAARQRRAAVYAAISGSKHTTATTITTTTTTTTDSGYGRPRQISELDIDGEDDTQGRADNGGLLIGRTDKAGASEPYNADTFSRNTYPSLLSSWAPQSSDSGYQSLPQSMSSSSGVDDINSVDLMKRFTSAPPSYLPGAWSPLHPDAFARRPGVSTFAPPPSKPLRASDPSSSSSPKLGTREILRRREAAYENRDEWSSPDNSRGEMSDDGDDDDEMIERRAMDVDDNGTTCFDWPSEDGSSGQNTTGGEEEFVNVSGDSGEDQGPQPRELDSDEELYCCSLLEPIIEEDSDDFLSSSGEDSLKNAAAMHHHHRNKPHPPSQPARPPPPPPPDDDDNFPPPALPSNPPPPLKHFSVDDEDDEVKTPTLQKEFYPTSPIAMANHPSPLEVVEGVFKTDSPLIPDTTVDSSDGHSLPYADDESESDESVQTVVRRPGSEGSRSSLSSVSSSLSGSLESSPLHVPRFSTAQQQQQQQYLQQQPSSSSGPADMYGSGGFDAGVDSENVKNAFTASMERLMSRVKHGNLSALPTTTDVSVVPDDRRDFPAENRDVNSARQTVREKSANDSEQGTSEAHHSNNSSEEETFEETVLYRIPGASFPTQVERGQEIPEIGNEVRARDVVSLQVAPLSSLPQPQAHDAVAGNPFRPGMIIDQSPNVTAPTTYAETRGEKGSGTNREDIDTRSGQRPPFDSSVNDTNENNGADNATNSDSADTESESESSSEEYDTNINENANNEQTGNDDNKGHIDSAPSGKTKVAAGIESFLTEFEDEPFARRLGRRDRSPDSSLENKYANEPYARRTRRRDKSPEQGFESKYESEPYAKRIGQRDRSPDRGPENKYYNEPYARRMGQRDRSPNRFPESNYKSEPYAKTGQRDESPEMEFESRYEREPYARRRGHRDRSPEPEFERKHADNVRTEPQSDTFIDLNTRANTSTDREPVRSVTLSGRPEPLLTELEEEPFSRKIDSSRSTRLVEANKAELSGRRPPVAKVDTELDSDYEKLPQKSVSKIAETDLDDRSPENSDSESRSDSEEDGRSSDEDEQSRSQEKSDGKETSPQKEESKIVDTFLTEFEEEPFARRFGSSRFPAPKETNLDDDLPLRSYDNVGPARKDDYFDRNRPRSTAKKVDPLVDELEEEPFVRKTGSRGNDRGSIRSDSDVDRSARSSETEGQDTKSYNKGADHDRSVSNKSDTTSIDSFLTELEEEPFARRLGRRRCSPDRTEPSRKPAPSRPDPVVSVDTRKDRREVIESPAVSKPAFPSSQTPADTRTNTIEVPESPSVSLPSTGGYITSTPQKPEDAGSFLPVSESPTISMPPLVETGPEAILCYSSSVSVTFTGREGDRPAAADQNEVTSGPFTDATESNAIEPMPRGYTISRCVSETSRSERRIFLVDKPMYPDFETFINSVPYTSETVAEGLEDGKEPDEDLDDYSAFVQDLRRPQGGSGDIIPTPRAAITAKPTPSLTDAQILSGNLVSPPDTDVFAFPPAHPSILPSVSSVSKDMGPYYSDPDSQADREEKSSKAEGSSDGVLDTSFDIDSTSAREKMNEDFEFLLKGSPAPPRSIDDGRRMNDDERISSDEKHEDADDEYDREKEDRSGGRRRRRRKDDSGDRVNDRKRRRNNRRNRQNEDSDEELSDRHREPSEDKMGETRGRQGGPDEWKHSPRDETRDASRDKDRTPFLERTNRHYDRKDTPDESPYNRSSQPVKEFRSTEQASDIMTKKETTDTRTPATTVTVDEGPPILFFQPAALIHANPPVTYSEPTKMQPQKPPGDGKGQYRPDIELSTPQQKQYFVDKSDRTEDRKGDSVERKIDRESVGGECRLEPSPQTVFVPQAAKRSPPSNQTPRPKPRQSSLTKPTPMPRSKSLGDNIGTPTTQETAIDDDDDVFQQGSSPNHSSDSQSSLDDGEGELTFTKKKSAPPSLLEPKRPRSLKEIRRSMQRTNARPMIAPFTLPDSMILPSRLKIMASRKNFLSSDNLDSKDVTPSFQEQFAAHKLAQGQTSTPAKERLYKSPNKRIKAYSTSQDQLEKLNYMLNYSRQSESSFDRALVDHLHEGCILTPQGRRNILDKTLSIENLQIDLPQHLRRFGSVTSLVETNLDTGETQETSFFPETNLDIFDCLFQNLHQPLQRSASMSDMIVGEPGAQAEGQGHDDSSLDRSFHGLRMSLPPSQTHKSTGKGRFAYRKYQKSKSLCTLETNLDDVGEEGGGVGVDGEMKRVPSVHELRVTKSLQKLNLPDWYKQSSLSKSSSCLLKYGSNSTMNSFSFSPSLLSSPCASTAPPAPNVVIKTRVVPPTNPRLLRSAPGGGTLSPTAGPGGLNSSYSDRKTAQTPVKLPSDKLREKEKNKNLMPIPIVPFAQIRAMFEKKDKQKKELKTDPTRTTVTTDKLKEEGMTKHSILKTSAVPSISISSEGDPSREEQQRYAEPKPVKKTVFSLQQQPPLETVPTVVVEDHHAPTVTVPAYAQPKAVQQPLAHNVYRATNGVSGEDGVGVDRRTVSSAGDVKVVSPVIQETRTPTTSVAAEKRPQPPATLGSSADKGLKTPKDASYKDQKSPATSKDPKQQFSPTRSLRQFFGGGKSKDKSGSGDSKKGDSSSGGGGGSLDSSFSSGDGVYEREPRRIGVTDLSRRFDAKPRTFGEDAAAVSSSSAFDRRSGGGGSGSGGRPGDSSFSSGEGVSPTRTENVPWKGYDNPQSSSTFPASVTSRSPHHPSSTSSNVRQPGFINYSRQSSTEAEQPPFVRLHEESRSSRSRQPESREPGPGSRFGPLDVREPSKFQKRIPGAGTSFDRPRSSAENGDHEDEKAQPGATSDGGVKAASDKKPLQETTV